ncbi:trigger factor [Oceanidesulfovibrio marinus]|uniref:Trigger factor n=1 Tax=Oceanidesulfovibrio marinus TaxID=370038 RepID=A0A6P1ZGE1_9BACT|nr:trigger factor [Oceanidesulfovibrio marinus]QJT07853.1 trigger factor [Oceanidesulfovibrio marinus]TVM33351.1 trigger factor [Oceanidesulfovibrio marinus]
MEYKVEEVSPVKRLIHVTVPAEEVDASLSATIAMYGRDVKIDGFRKGKVPASVVEGRFHKQIYSEATTELVNVHINEIVGELKVNPVSRIDFDGDLLKRGEEYTYTLNFEVMPEFPMPAYEGIEVEEEEPVVDPDEVQAVIDRIRNQMAELQPIGEDRAPKDGEIAVIDFQAYDENGEPIEGIKADNFELPLGEGQALVDFESVVKGLKADQEGEGEVVFPEDFLNEELAGKKVTMKVKLHAVKERKLPEVDADFAKKAGGFESVDQMKETVEKSYMQSRSQLARSQAQKELLDKLLKMVDFEIPDAMLDRHVNAMVDEQRHRMEQQGKSLESQGKTVEELREEVKPHAEELSRSEIFLLTLAHKEEMQVSEQEIDFYFRQMASRSGEDYNQLKQLYMENNLIWVVRDKLLADKAMELLYSKAAVTKVPPKKDEEGGEAPEAEGSAESEEE